ncbi:hypothetical protein N9N67_02510 [Bacteriovoracaceae bacterium]|nr:hypothetical protein [Bacteriovoracaceae bacterium]
MIYKALKLLLLLMVSLSTFSFSMNQSVREAKSQYRANPNFENLVMVGNSYFRANKLKSSIKIYKQALRHKKADKGFLYGMIGFAYFNLADDNKSYDYLIKATKYENPEQLNKQIDYFLDQLDLKYQDDETKEFWGIIDQMFLEVDISRSSNSNPSARSSTDEDDGLEIESDIHNNFSYYFGYNFLNLEKFSSSFVFEKFDEYYTTETDNNNYSETIQLPLNYYVDNLILNYKYSKQRDYDNEASATLETETSQVGLTIELNNSELAFSYSTAIIDNVNEDYYYLRGTSTSYGIFYTYYLESFSFYTSYDRYDQNLNDDDLYFESNTGQTLSIGIQYRYKKLIGSIDLSRDTRTFVEDEEEEEQRIDGTRSLSFNLEYEFRETTSLYINSARSTNASTFDGENASVDYNYSQNNLKFGLVVAF